jgi:hypothetical protein
MAGAAWPKPAGAALVRLVKPTALPRRVPAAKTTFRLNCMSHSSGLMAFLWFSGAEIEPELDLSNLI